MQHVEVSMFDDTVYLGFHCISYNCGKLIKLRSLLATQCLDVASGHIWHTRSGPTVHGFRMHASALTSPQELVWGFPNEGEGCHMLLLKIFTIQCRKIARGAIDRRKCLLAKVSRIIPSRKSTIHVNIQTFRSITGPLSLLVAEFH